MFKVVISHCNNKHWLIYLRYSVTLINIFFNIKYEIVLNKKIHNLGIFGFTFQFSFVHFT